MIHNENDSTRKFTVPRPLTVINVLVAVGTGVSALLAVVDPTVLSPGGAGAGAEFYALAYAARAVPLAVAVVAVLLTARSRAAIPVVLALAAAVQFVDVGIGVVQGIPGMVVGAAISGVVPAVTLWAGRRNPVTS